MKRQEKNEIYSIRKFKVGVGSALIGLSFLGTTGLINEVPVINSLSPTVVQAAEITPGTNGFTTSATLMNDQSVKFTGAFQNYTITGSVASAKPGDTIVYEVENVDLSKISGHVIIDDKTGREIARVRTEETRFDAHYRSKETITDAQKNFNPSTQPVKKGKIILTFSQGVESARDINFKIDVKKAQLVLTNFSKTTTLPTKIKSGGKELASSTVTVESNGKYESSSEVLSELNSEITGKNDIVINGKLNMQIATNQNNVVRKIYKGDTLTYKITSNDLQFNMDQLKKDGKVYNNRLINNSNNTTYDNAHGVVLFQSNDVTFKVKSISPKEVTLEVVEVPDAFNVGEVLNLDLPINVVSLSGTVNSNQGTLNNQSATLTYNGKENTFTESKTGNVKITGVNLKGELKVVDTTPTITEEDVPFETERKANDKLLPGEEKEIQKGENGRRKKIVTYSVDTGRGEKVANTPTYELIKQPKNRIVEYGTGKAGVIPKGTVYTDDKSKATEGEDGQRHPNGKVIKEPKNKVVFVDTTSTVTTEKIPFETIRKANDKMLPTDKEVEKVKGVDGERKKTVTYTFNKVTGAKIPNKPSYEIIKNKIDRVVEYGAGKTKEGKIPIVYTNGPDEPGRPEILHPNGTVIQQGTPKKVHVNDTPEITEEKIPFEKIRKGNDKMLPSDKEIVSVKGIDGIKKKTVTFTIDPKTGEKVSGQPTYEIIKNKIDEVVEYGTGVTSIIPKGDYKLIEDPNLPEGKEIIDNKGEDGVLHPDGKTIIKEKVQPVKRIGKPVTSKGTETPPVLNVEDLTLTQYLDKDGNRLKLVKDKVNKPETFIKNDKGFVTHELDKDKSSTEENGITTYYYKEVATSKGPEITPVLDVEDLSFTQYLDKDGNRLKLIEEKVGTPENFIKDNKGFVTHELDKDKSSTEENGITTYYYKKVETSKGTETPPVLNVEDLTLTQYLDKDGNRLKLVEKKVNEPETFIKNDKGFVTHELDKDKSSTEENGITTYYYKEVVTSKGPEITPVLEVEDLTLTQYLDKDGNRLKLVEERVNNPETFIKNDKGFVTHELDKDKSSTEENGIVSYYYKEIQTSKSTDLPPIHEVTELKVTVLKDENGKEITTFIGDEFDKAKSEIEKEYELVEGPIEIGDGITNYIYQTKVKTPKDKIEIENPEKLTGKEKELILEKVKEYNPNKIIEITEDGFIKLYDRGDKTDKVQTLKITDLIKKKEIKEESPKKVNLPKIEDVEKVKPEIVSQSAQVRKEEPKKQESSTRQLPETNSDSIASLAALSAVSTLGVGFAAIRRKRQSA